LNPHSAIHAKSDSRNGAFSIRAMNFSCRLKPRQRGSFAAVGSGSEAANGEGAEAGGEPEFMGFFGEAKRGAMPAILAGNPAKKSRWPDFYGGTVA
jgi:hypothetical protein